MYIAPQVSLAHGLQHENALVRYTALGALCSIWSALQPLLADLADATSVAAAADMDAHGDAHSAAACGAAAAANGAPAADAAPRQYSQWAAWGARLTSWLQARLPEPQLLLALHTVEAQEVRRWLTAALHAALGDVVCLSLGRSGAACALAGHRQWLCQAGPVLVAAATLQPCHHRGCMPVTQADAAGVAASGKELDATMAEEEGEAADADETAGVTEQSPKLDGQAALLSLRLLAAIAGYQRCLPGAMADNRIDIGRLIPLVRICRSCTVAGHLSLERGLGSWHCISYCCCSALTADEPVPTLAGPFAGTAGSSAGVLHGFTALRSLMCLCRIR